MLPTWWVGQQYCMVGGAAPLQHSYGHAPCQLGAVAGLVLRCKCTWCKTPCTTHAVGVQLNLLQGTAVNAALAHCQPDPYCVLAAGEISCPAAHLERMRLSPCAPYWTWLTTETFAGGHCMRGFGRLSLSCVTCLHQECACRALHTVSARQMWPRFDGGNPSTHILRLLVLCGCPHLRCDHMHTCARTAARAILAHNMRHANECVCVSRGSG